MSMKDFFTSGESPYRRGYPTQDCRVDNEVLYNERKSLKKVREDYEFLYLALNKKIKEASLSVENANFDRMEESVKRINHVIQSILMRFDEAAEKLQSLERLVVEMNDCRWR